MSILASILISILASGLTFHSLPTESAGTNIETVCQDSLGNMWFGGRDGLTLYDGSRYTSFRHNAETAGGGIPDNRIYKIVCDADGRIWVAHMSGLSVYDHAVGDFRSYASPDGAVEEVLPLGDGRFYFSGNGRSEETGRQYCRAMIFRWDGNNFVKAQD